jgi:hypothetical protein
MTAQDISFGELRPHHREFFSGVPIWRISGSLYRDSVFTYSRAVDPYYGAFYWRTNESELLGSSGTRYWDTLAAWGPGIAENEDRGKDEDDKDEDDEDEDDEGEDDDDS